MKRLLSALAACALIAAYATAQTQVTTGVQYGKKYGVTYMLPRTEIAISVKATKHSYQPGEFSQYAARYLRLDNVKQEAEVYWTFDDVSLSIVGVPDADNIYFVEMKDRTTAPLMELTEDGIVRSINMPFSGITPESQSADNSNKSASPLDPRQFLTEEILMASSRAKQAELVSKEIFNLRESKRDLISGNAENTPKDGGQLQIMLDNLNQQEEALTQMFQGIETTETTATEIRIEPHATAEQEVAFRFSSKLGVVDKDDLSGEPVYISIVNEETIPEPSEEVQQDKKKLEGVAYNVPGQAQVTLTYNHGTLVDKEVALTQFGSKEYLAPLLFNRNTVTKVQFDVNTGGLIKIDRE